MLMEISNAFNNQLKYKGKDLDGIFSIFWTSFDGKIFIPFPSKRFTRKMMVSFVTLHDCNGLLLMMQDT